MFKKLLSLSLGLSLFCGHAIPAFHAESTKNHSQQVISNESYENKNSKDYRKKYKEFKEKYENIKEECKKCTESSRNANRGWKGVVQHPFRIIFKSGLYSIVGTCVSGIFFLGSPGIHAFLTLACGICGGISEAMKWY